MKKTLLEVRDLVMHFQVGSGSVHAVDGVSFDLQRGETMGVVGESGSGKTSLGYAMLRLLPANGRILKGSITFDGIDLVPLPEEDLRSLRWKRFAMIFQNAMSALNPVFRVGDQIVDAIRHHTGVTRAAARERAGALFELVGLSRARLRGYPHEFSGGMKQRAMIALALSCGPDLVVADEPTTALDVVAQGQVLRQIKQLQEELHLAMIFVSHDISVVAEICRNVAVMYAGEFVEYGPTEHLLTDPRHPYTMALLRSFPSVRGPLKTLLSVPGSPPDLVRPPSGCRFHPRCPFAQQICREVSPEPTRTFDGGWARCHFTNEIRAQGRDAIEVLEKVP
ncbi:MAG TPA: ABC transporter ATP-binding protein [Candidatus Limnocylindria bacterium]|nr:ABC transporter ATP-binding protein [Candidatus Limnocylindria bacterium]